MTSPNSEVAPERHQYDVGFYTVEIYRPTDADSWDLVHSERSAWGGGKEVPDHPLYAALQVLEFRWPVDIHDQTLTEYLTLSRRRQDGLQGRVGWRVTVIGYQVERTYTVGELLTAAIIRQVQEREAAKDALEEAAEALKVARRTHRAATDHARWAAREVDEHARLAAAVGVPDDVIAKAKRAPRRPRARKRATA